MNKKNTEKLLFQTVGRRKSSTARVKLMAGSPEIIVNNKPALEFFPYKTLVQDLEQGLKVTDTQKDFSINIKVNGGGFAGQAGACRLGIARAILKFNPDHRSALKAAGLLTCDARIKERKKCGLRKARRARQYSRR